ncbi:MAG: inorganic diphosphatase [Nitrospinaceae bacterium]|nr:inorganic diphosphatase [Nitrospinaceae bacterium]NIW58833.1 inorganic diphosphatase [Nitrospinaceae bacterium]
MAAVWMSLLAIPVHSWADSPEALAPGLDYVDPQTIKGPKSFLEGYPSTTPDNGVYVVVEIPAGTNAKWEVTKPDGLLRWEEKNGKPRVVKYLAYPGNYGMVPQTLLPEEDGGDGDPLDVLILGSALPRGSVARVRVLGVLRLLDRGQRDDKLIAIPLDHPVIQAHSLKELDEKHPGVLTIVETWFVNYKGPGKMTSRGYGNALEAARMLRQATRAYRRNHP